MEKVGNYTVLTTSINYASTRQLMLKRLMDIAGGLVGCIFTGIICIFVGPAIYIASPGPIFFAQERVGKNGKKFKMYKFRSMYMDAEERKAELMKDNKLGDGKMFKLDFDPRVIGNKILPDGTHKTGIGDFIRRTSLDEFPQFFNVLRGDMSIIGTRPPLISETNLYELHHRARLAIKPGITGMWQVSGRSDITDFEEVVRLDKEYITNWNIGLDTMASVFSRGLSMITVPIFTRIMSTSEIGMVNLYNSWYSLLNVIATLSLTSGGFQAAMKDFEGERDQYQSSVLTLTSTMAIILGCIYFLIPNIWNKITGLPSVLMILMLVVFFFAPAQDFWLLRQRYEYKYKMAGALTMGSALASTILSVIVVLNLNKVGSDQIAVGRLYATNIVSIIISAILWIKLYVKGKTIVNIDSRIVADCILYYRSCWDILYGF